MDAILQKLQSKYQLLKTTFINPANKPHTQGDETKGLNLINSDKRINPYLNAFIIVRYMHKFTDEQHYQNEKFACLCPQTM